LDIPSNRLDHNIDIIIAIDFADIKVTNRCQIKRKRGTSKEEEEELSNDSHCGS
jgi:hypothetical protein